MHFLFNLGTVRVDLNFTCDFGHSVITVRVIEGLAMLSRLAISGLLEIAPNLNASLAFEILKLAWNWGLCLLTIPRVTMSTELATPELKETPLDDGNVREGGRRAAWQWTTLRTVSLTGIQRINHFRDLGYIAYFNFMLIVINIYIISAIKHFII